MIPKLTKDLKNETDEETGTKGAVKNANPYPVKPLGKSGRNC